MASKQIAPEAEDVIEEPQVEAEVLANIDEVLATSDLEVVYIKLPEPYAGGVKARPLTMEEMHKLRKSATRKVRNAQGKWSQEYDETAANKALIRMSLVAPAVTPQQIDQMFLKNNKLASAILVVLSLLNGMTKEEAEENISEAEEEFPE
jgi:hypothetical protein